ncbi:tandem-95 repeat protein [Bosea beijingensis]|uniref:tandem-95 repeat protein n=1 Tax=Bosea beijingensis TaxID=3068632 RepID=UPI0027412B06|nr:Ig-like domain-containing protein [Bosea sp. REN20]
MSNFNGADSFAITVTDSSGATLVVPVSFTVAPVDDPPVGSDLAISLPEDGSFAGTLPAATDPEGQPVSYALGRPSGFGTATVNPDGSFSYVPAANFSGTDSFTYLVSDGTSVSAYTVIVTVTAVNDAPVANNDAVAIPQNAQAILPVLANDVDVDGDPLTIVAAEAGIGTVSINSDGTLTYTPPNGFVGVATITYTISDGKRGLATGQVLVSVLPETATVPSGGQRPPATQPTTQPPFPLQTDGETFILDAVGRIADLGGISTSLTAHGPILSALNDISPLDGLAGKSLVIGRSLPGVDPRGETSLDRYLRHDAERRAIDRTLPEVQGFSRSMELRPQSGDDAQRGELTVQSVLRGRTITLEFTSRFAEADQRATEYRVLLADGRPLPGWLVRAGKDMVVGDMPIDLDEVRLKIVALLVDGGSAERNIIVDLSTSEIRPAPDQQGWTRPPLFQERFGLPAELTQSQIAFLAEALRHDDLNSNR